jgi:hypothetical protein
MARGGVTRNGYMKKSNTGLTERICSVIMCHLNSLSV